MMRCVPLDPGLDGRRIAYLRGLTGADELAAVGGAVALLDRLLVDKGPSAVAPGQAARLPVCDRDRILARLHGELFGDTIDADAVCHVCSTPFSVRFSLTEVIAAHPPRHPDGVEGPDAGSLYRGWGVRFRLPATADLDAVAALSAADRRDALLSACVIEGEVSGLEEAIEGAMAALGPTLDIDLDSHCPHCAAAVALRFDIASFFLKSLNNERRFLLREAHRIASGYGWSHAEIMGLPRDERQDFVRLIDGEGGRPRLMAAAE